MYFYFTWPKMNASATGGDGSGVLPSSSISCNKRGSGAPLVNGNEASAAPAGVTATTQGAGFADSADSVRPQVCGYSNNIHNISNNNKSDNVTALNSKESTIGSGGTGSADVPECEVDCYTGVNGSGEEMKKTDSSITDDKNSNDGDSKTGDGRCVFVTTPAVSTTGTVLAASTSCTSSKRDPDSSLVLPRSAGDGTGQSEAATNTGDRTINTACFLAMHHYQGSRWEGKRLCFPSSTNSRATHCSKAPTKSGESGFKEQAAPAAVYSSATSSFPGIVNSSNGPHTAFGKIDRLIGVPCCGKEDSSDKIARENSSVSSSSRSCRREPKSAKGRVRLYRVRTFVAASAAASNTSNNNSTTRGNIIGFNGALTQKRLSSDAGGRITFEEGSTAASIGNNITTTAGTQDSATEEGRIIDLQVVNQPGDLLLSLPGPKATWADGRTCFVKKEGYVTNRNYSDNDLLQKAPLGSKGKTVVNNGVSLEPTKSTNGFRKALDLTMCGAGADCVDGVEGACTSELPSLGELEAGTREAVKRQAEMEVRALRISKRLQVVQAKQVERHAVQQLKGLVESVLRGDCTLPGGGASVQAQDTLYRTSSLLCNALQAGPSHFGKHPFLPRTTSPLSLPLFPAQLGSGEMSWLVGSLGAALRTVETAFDSDATASSSGGESDVEERELGAARPTLRHRPLRSRVEWQWVEQRAKVGSRWAWLQAQVSDLEYRIRQQTELYRHLRTSKVPVVLCEAPSLESLLREPSHFGPGQTPVSPSPSVSSLLSPAQLLHNFCHQSSRVAQSLGSVLSPSNSSGSPFSSPGVLNGSLHSSEVCDSSPEALWKRQRVDCLSAPPSPLDSSYVAARVRPLQRHQRRRLVRIGGTPYVRAKPLVLRCSCELPSSCILCGGRRLSTQTPDHSGCTVEECGAALEPSFHPILSFSHDLPLHLLVEGKLQDAGHSLSPHWLKGGRATPGPHRHMQRESGPTLHRTKEETQGPHRVKALRLSQIKRKRTDPSKNACHNLASSLLSSAKYGHSKSSSERLLKHRLESWQTAPNFQTIPTLEKSQSQIRKPHSTLHPPGCASRGERLQRGAGSPSLYIPKTSPEAQSQTTAIPASDPTLTGSLTTTTPQQPSRRRRGESSFDINNIVIPMSMALGARVEKLQYKEILTPSWRHLDPEPVDFTSSEREEEEAEEVEDTSDETYLSRHSQWEERERSRWGSWAPSSTQRRVGRPSNKGDGRLTPQPPLQSKLGLCQPASPPELCPPLLSELPYLWTHSPPEPWDQRGPVLSFSEDTTSSLPDDELLTVLPWEPRCFPLSDGDLQLLQQSPEDEDEAFQQIRWPPGTGRNSSVATGSPSTQGIRTESTDSGISLGSMELTPTFLNPQVPHYSLDIDSFPPPSHSLAAISMHHPAPHCSLEMDTLAHRLTPISLQPPLSHSKHSNPLPTSQHPLFSSVLHLTHCSPPDTDDIRTSETAASKMYET